MDAPLTPSEAALLTYSMYWRVVCEFMEIMYPWPNADVNSTECQEIIALRQRSMATFRTGALMAAARAYVEQQHRLGNS